MKKRWIFLLLLFIPLLLLMTPASASAEETEMTRLGTLFQKAGKTDGAYTEMYALELVEAFEKNSAVFVQQLSQEAEQTQQEVTLLLTNEICWASAERKAKLREKLTALRVDANEEVVAVLDCVERNIKSWEEQRKQEQISTPPPQIRADGFHRETILKHITFHLDSMGRDDAFYTLLADAYAADPELLAELISAYTPTQIDYLAKGVAKGFTINKKTVPTLISDAEHYDIVQQIERHIADEAILESKAELPAGKNVIGNGGDSRSLSVPSVDMIMFSSDPLNTGDTETMRVVVSESFYTNSSRSYYMEIYQRSAFGTVFRTGKSFVIPPGVTELPVIVDLTFTEAGPCQVIIKVYSSAGGTLLTTRYSESYTVVEDWHITVSLPVNRAYTGVLTLYKANGTLLHTGICLGKSAYGYPMSQINGDTPTGGYTGYLYTHWSSTYSYGPYQVVNMQGQSGLIAEYGHRSDIWIHGGDPSTDTTSASYPLRPTYGCVRVTNNMQFDLECTITDLVLDGYHREVGNITIYENAS